MNIFDSESINKDGISVWFFFLFALISGVSSLFGYKYLKRRCKRRECKVIVRWKGKELELCGINDSGNLLKDAVSGRCVIPIEINKCGSLFPQSIICAAKNTGLFLAKTLDTEDARRIRIIPSFSTSGERMILALRPDLVEIINESGIKYRVDALVAPLELGKGQIETLVPDELMM